MNEIYTRLIPLPVKVGGFTVKDSNGDYNVYINACIDDTARIVAYMHEIDHINRGDLDGDIDIIDVERGLYEGGKTSVGKVEGAGV